MLQIAFISITQVQKGIDALCGRVFNFHKDQLSLPWLSGPWLILTKMVILNIPVKSFQTMSNSHVVGPYKSIT